MEKMKMRGENLHKAIKEGDVERVKKVLEKGADVCHLRYINSTPLKEAISYTHKIPEGKDENSIVKLLIEYGANVNRAYKLYETYEIPVMTAAHKTSTLKFLMDNGADINATAPDFDKTPPFHSKMTAIKNIRYIPYEGGAESMKYLEDSGKLTYGTCGICEKPAINIHDAYYFYHGEKTSSDTHYSGGDTITTDNYNIVNKPESMLICHDCIKKKQWTHRITTLILWLIWPALIPLLLFVEGDLTYLVGLLLLIYTVVICSIKFNNEDEYIGDKMAIARMKGSIKDSSSFFTRSEYNRLRTNN